MPVEAVDLGLTVDDASSDPCDLSLRDGCGMVDLAVLPQTQRTSTRVTSSPSNGGVLGPRISSVFICLRTERR